ncbi:MAG: single-stranded DNA-binding protein [Firmicutes bacterium]|nr:single-stranded DNA-binding protein [Bacillota bacterium]
MLNRVVLIGRLTADPALRYTPNGVPVTNFTLAVERPFRSQSGEREVDFIDVVVWRRQAEHCANHLNKGRLVGVDGRLQVRSYDAQDGTRRRAWEVVADSVQFLDWPKDNQQLGPEPGDFGGSTEDDLPF